MHRGIWGVAFLLLFGSTRGLAEDDKLTKTLTALSSNIVAVQSLKACFVQEKHLAVFDHVVTLKGRMYMAKPNRFAWHVFDPIRYSMVAMGETVHQWDGEARQESSVSLRKNPALRAATGQMKQWFLGDYLGLRSEYRVTLVQENPVSLTFEPLESNAAAKYIKRISVRFRKDNRYLDRITVEETGGDRTDLRFHDTALDGDIPSEAWDVRFTPPEQKP